MIVRYFSHYAGDPYYNMAFDEWMFEQALARDGSSYLRLYTWARPAVTFGFNQDYERALDHSRLGDLPVIRRVTGGRALLHDPSELTYSLAANTTGRQSFTGVSTREISFQISGMLMDFLRLTGVECDLVRQSSAQNSRPEFFHKAPCFDSFARYEIVSEGRKIVASAQRRIENTLFQHGSVKIGGVASHPAIALQTDDSQCRIDLDAVSECAFHHMEQQFVRAFGRWLGGPGVTSDTTDSENLSIQRRVQSVRKNCLDKRDIFKQK